ncbi:T9SS type A sorting domain-containing protein [bacterium]|nr:T9SS type A sorting domain-containing protein [bacterium]
MVPVFMGSTSLIRHPLPVPVSFIKSAFKLPSGMRVALLLASFCPMLLSLPARAQEVAQFNVLFESTWSAQTHPVAFPGNPHFSGLIGTTHNSDATYWALGQLASQGIKNMAETGSKTSLVSIFNGSDDAGMSDYRINAGGIGTSPGSVVVSFSARESHPLLTLVSMLAPSPDWFVGVSGLPLRSPQGWIAYQEVDLYVYDAGTDSGASYAAANAATVPATPISKLEDGHMVVNGTVRKVGRFVVTLEGITGTSAESDEPLPFHYAVQSYPNPFSDELTLEVTSAQTERVRIHVVDLLGREVDSIYAGVLSAGVNRLRWNAPSIGAGRYWIQISSSTGNRYVSVLKTR